MNTNTNAVDKTTRPFSLNLIGSEGPLSSNNLQQGKLYELIIFIYTLVNNTTKFFDLGKDIKFGDKFDDLVVKEHENNYNQYTFLQIKQVNNNINTTYSLIDSEVLLGKRQISLHIDDFELLKYFKSYLRIKDQLNSRNDNSKIKRLIIFTNAQLDEDELNRNVGDIRLKKIKENGIVPNTNINFDDNTQISYEITKVKDIFLRKMKINLKSDFANLSEELALYVRSNRTEMMTLDKDYFAYYHKSLIDERIIEVTEHKQGKRIIKRGKFSQIFIEEQNLSCRAQKLKVKVIDILNKKGMTENEVKTNMKDAEWAVSNDFDLKQTEDVIFLPNYEINENDFNNFFRILELRVKQLDNKEMLYMLRNKEIKKTFLEYFDTSSELVEFLICDFLQSWRIEKSALDIYVLNDERSKFIDNLKFKISKPKAIHRTQEHVKLLEMIINKYDLYYNGFCLFDKNCLKHRFLAIKTKSNILTSVKLIQFLNTINQPDIIFINLDTLLHQNEIIKVVDAFRGDQFRLIIISYTVFICDNISEELFNKLSKITQNNKRKTVIFITSTTNDSLIKKCTTLKEFKEYDDKFIGLQYIKSPFKILERKIIIQEHCLKLSDFINGTNYNLIDEKVIDILIKDQEINIGSKPFCISDLEGAYFDVADDVDVFFLIKELLCETSNNIYIFDGIFGSNLIDEMLKSLKAVNKALDIDYIKNILNILNKQDILKPVAKKIHLCDFVLNKENFRQICRANPEKKVYWVTVQNGGFAPKFMLQQIYNPNFYITGNRFNSEILIDKNIKKLLVSNDLRESFIISMKHKTDFVNWLELADYNETEEFEKNCENNKIEFVTCNDGVVTFREIVNHHPSQTLHLLKFEQSNLIWCKSYGSLQNLVKFRAKPYKNTTPLFGEDAIIHEIKDKKVVIIAGDPGIGKSTTLVKLCGFKYVTKSGIEESILRSHWLFRVSVKDHLQIVKDINIRARNDSEINKEIANFLSKVDNSCSSNFTKSLLSIALVKDNFGKPVLILFDGFDEVLDKVDRDDLLSLLVYIKDRTKAKFWITTRPHFESTLETALSNFAIRLEKMGSHKVCEFVKKYLSNSIYFDCVESHNTLTCNEAIKNTKIDDYANAFTSRIQKVFNGDMSKFIGTPLHLNLILGDVVSHFKIWIEEDTSETPNFSYLSTNIWAVYENFIERKYKIYLKKANVNEKLRQEQDQMIFDSYHRSLAKTFMFNSLIKKDLEHFKNILLLVGIVISHERTIEFIHPTFSEYFAASEIIRWIVKWKNGLTNHFINLQKQEYFLEEVLIDPKYKMVRIFLNVKLLNEKFENIKLQDIYYNNIVLLIAARENHKGIINFILKNHESAKINDPCILHAAFDSGNLDMMEFLIINGANINSKHNIYSDQTVLHKAARFGNIEIVKFCVKLGADFNAKDKYDISVLHTAVKGKNFEVIEFLVTIGADIKAVNEYGRSVLHSAVKSNDLTMINFLIEKGANVDVSDESGESVLHSATECSNLDIIEILVANGANVHSKDKQNVSVLHNAVTSNNLEIVEFLVSKKVDVNGKDNMDTSVLHRAVQRSNLTIVKFLQLNDADVHAKNKNDISVLHMAVKSNKLDIVKFLVAIGVDVHSQDKNKNSLLHDAAESGNLEMLSFLISLGIDVHVKNEKKESVLHKAAMSGNLETVKLLNVKGISVNDKDILGNSILHIVSERKNLKIVKFLVEKGANVHSRNHDGMSALNSVANIHILDTIIFVEKDNFGKNKEIRDYKYFLHSATKIAEVFILKGANVNTKDKKRTSALMNAAHRGNFDMVKLLINEGANIDAKDIYGKSILHYATMSHHLKITQFLVERGANINSKDNKGRSVLHKADLEVIQYLITKGVDINEQDENGKTILHEKFSDLAVLQLLVKAGADITIKCINNQSVLHLAVKSYNIEVVKFLIAAGANIHDRSENFQSVLHIAADTSYLAMIRYLVKEGADINSFDKDNRSVLHISCKNGDFDTVEFLMRRNAIFNHKDQNDISILHCAAESGHLEMVQFLVAKGLDVNAIDKNNKSVLDRSVEAENLDMVKFLITQGANINVKDHEGTSVLHRAAKLFNLKMVQFLVEAGLNVKDEDYNKISILHSAVCSSNLDLVKFIIESGANVHAEDKDEKSVLHNAVQTRNLALVKYLVQMGANVNSKSKSILKIAAKFGDLDILEFLVTNNADVNHPSILHNAVASGNIEMVEFIIVNGADINAKDDEAMNRSVLHVAAEYNSSDEMIKFLVAKGADVNAKDQNNSSVLHKAVETGDLDMVKFLVTNDAKVNVEDNNGKSVLECAEESGCLELIQLVVEAGGGSWECWLKS